ncbi:MAG: sialidase family protein [Deltaproteobacteria bacterium]
MQMSDVLIGTTKGAFIARKDGVGWKVSGPHCDGAPVNHLIGDPETGAIYAAGGGDWHGARVWSSKDQGLSWTSAQLTTGQMDKWAANDPNFAAMIGWTDEPRPFGEDFSQIWSLAVVDGALYAGTKPANLLKSTDGGATFQRVDGLTDHPSRPDWNGGAAGLVLHTIVKDPKDPRAMWVGISAAGVFATEDGGASWERRNRMSNSHAHVHHDHPAAPSGGETGHCVHNIVRAKDGRLYQQNHHGVFRSRDNGLTWDDITDGLPSTFGFPISVHPNDPDMIFTVPLNGDQEGRFPPNAACAVWRSSDGGDTWQAMRNGLPQEFCFFTVLRQAMAMDTSGMYFGTNSGSVFATHDNGESFTEIVRHLPTILSVETL